MGLATHSRSRALDTSGVLIVGHDDESGLADAVERRGLRALVQTATVLGIREAEGERVAAAVMIVAGVRALDLVAYLRHHFPAAPIIARIRTGDDRLAQAAIERGATATVEMSRPPREVAGVVQPSIRGARRQGSLLRRALDRLAPRV